MHLERNGRDTSAPRYCGTFRSPIVLWVETIRMHRVEGCGPPGGVLMYVTTDITLLCR